MPHRGQKRVHQNYGQHINLEAVKAAIDVGAVNLEEPGEVEMEHNTTVDISFQSEVSDLDGIGEDEEDGEDIVSERDSVTEFMTLKPISKDKVLLVLKDNSNFYIKGKLQIKVLKGWVEVMGHCVTPSSGPTNIYSPRGYSLLDLQAHKGDTGDNIQDRIIGEGVSFDDARDATGECVVVIRKLQEGWTKYLHTTLNLKTKLNLLQRDNNLPIELQNEEEVTTVEKILDCNFVHPSSLHVRLFEPGEDWNLALSSVDISLRNNIQPRMLVAGGKGVGKSTFVRWMTNKLLATSPGVAFLDLDPGQAELSVPGYLSLAIIKEPFLGPNFCNVDRDSELKLFLGDINVSNCPGRFMMCIRKLVSYLNTEKFRSLPLVVNTMGWCKGIGLMLVIDTIRLVQPTTLVQLHSRFHRKNYPYSLCKDAVTTSHDSWTKVKPTSPLHYNLLEFLAVPESREAKDMRTKDYWGLPDPRLTRELVLLSSLGRAGGLENIPVYSVPFNMVALHVSHINVAPEGLLAALNLALVDICSVGTNLIRKPKLPGLYSTLQSTPLVPSLGLGIIRNIDMSGKILYLATAASIDNIKIANCLVGGCVKIPDSVILSKRTADSPYIDPSTENPLDLPWQRNFKPRGHSAQ